MRLNNGKHGLRIYKSIKIYTLRRGKHKAILKIGDNYFQTPGQETMSKAVASLYKAVDNPEDLLLEHPNKQGALHTHIHEYMRILINNLDSNIESPLRSVGHVAVDQ